MCKVKCSYSDINIDSQLPDQHRASKKKSLEMFTDFKLRSQDQRENHVSIAEHAKTKNFGRGLEGANTVDHLCSVNHKSKYCHLDEGAVRRTILKSFFRSNLITRDTSY
eukprot:snap_masked-scaffold_16-processed-gene-5.53-mRNA-1 protein AED:1.00 eAED:1.00 QI:0/0/0/0/1/1/2/0/108